MQKTALRKSDNTLVKLRPLAERYDGPTRLEPLDDDWHVTVNDAGLVLSLSRTGHVKTLGFDHIHHWSTNPNGGVASGILDLNGQLTLSGNSATFEPMRRNQLVAF